MKIGRPRLSTKEKKGQITGVRLRGEERLLLEKAAAKSSQKLSDWMRDTLLKRAYRQARGTT
jgi:uncharacterized protein (DUF1778 family)